MLTIADKGSVLDNGPFLVFMALVVLACVLLVVAVARHDRKRRIEAAMRRHPAGKARE